MLVVSGAVTGALISPEDRAGAAKTGGLFGAGGAPAGLAAVAVGFDLLKASVLSVAAGAVGGAIYGSMHRLMYPF